VVAALIFVTAWPVTLVLRKRASRRRVICVLAAAQACMHGLFLMATAWADAGPMAITAGAPPPDHQHSAIGMTMTQASVAHGSPATAHAMDLVPSPAMLAAHAVAALLLGLTLASCERLLFSIIGLLAQAMLPGLRAGLGVLRLIFAALTGEIRLRQATARLTETMRPARCWVTVHVISGWVLWRGPPAAALTN
jgi:hypothetical protein